MTQNLFNRFSCGGVLLGLCLAAGLIISAAQVTRAWLHIADSQVISVTGSAYQDVASDKAVWNASFTAEGNQLADALQKLKADAARVQSFFSQRGVTNAEISAISIQRLKPLSNGSSDDDASKRTIGFRLSQTVRLESGDVRRVMDLQQQSGALVEEGVELDDLGIQFIYSKTAEAKIEMLAAATKDARQRAEQIASQGGRKIRSLRAARMGVFQITPRNSNETSTEGINDTTSKEKTIRSVVSATFTME
ncbi:MAG: SIMPL domain-containing protein [Verrucomicrobiota bacterium]|jgi:hypothetical protein